MFTTQSPAVAVRALHLDLKGLPPTPNRLLEMLDIMAAARFNCALVEWEDTYPWTFDRSLRCSTAYSDETINRFLDHAHKLSIEVVPLIQSFGHLENVLGRPRYAKLRESSKTVSDLCPLHAGARPLVELLIDDILRLHKGRIRRLHLGGDEVWTLGSCRRCQAFVRSHGKAALYLHHMDPLLERVGSLGLMPIIWDDMMRQWPHDMLRSLAPKAQLMVWSYAADPFARVTTDIFERYASAGVQLWGAGACKGADGPSADLPDLRTRALNMTAWAQAATEHSLIGVAATAWSRYNTYMTPCESLEASLDAVLMAGAILWNGEADDTLQAQAHAMLRTGRLKALAGEQSWSCREAARELAECWTQAQRLLDQARQFPALARARGRFSPSAAEAFLNGWKQNARRIKKAAAAFTKSHANRVAPQWLKEYVNSRTLLPVELSKAFR